MEQVMPIASSNCGRPCFNVSFDSGDILKAYRTFSGWFPIASHRLAICFRILSLNFGDAHASCRIDDEEKSDDSIVAIQVTGSTVSSRSERRLFAFLNKIDA